MKQRLARSIRQRLGGSFVIDPRHAGRNRGRPIIREEYGLSTAAQNRLLTRLAHNQREIVDIPRPHVANSSLATYRYTDIVLPATHGACSSVG